MIGPENYGSVSYLISIAALASTMSLFGIPQSILVFEKSQPKILNSLNLFAIISGTIASILLVLIYREYALGVYVIGANIFSISSNKLLGSELYSKYTKLLLISKILMIPFSLSLYSVLYVPGIILGLGSAYFVYLFVFFKSFKISFDIPIIKKKFRFILQTFILVTSGTLGSTIDRLLINEMFTLSVLGNYHFALQFISFFHFIPSIIFKYSVPKDVQDIDNKPLKQFTIIISIPITMSIYFLTPIIFPSIFPQYSNSIIIIQIGSFSLIPLTISYIMSIKLIAKEKNFPIIISAYLGIFAKVLGIIILGNFYGVEGIAWSFLISSCIGGFSLCVFSKIRKLNF